MTVPLPLPIELINQSARFNTAIQEIMSSSVIALDTESNSFHRYPEQLCLIQAASKQNIYIIDTISLQDLNPLKKTLENNSIKKVLHSADYDIRSLDRHYGIRIRNLYDTSIASRFVGIVQFGLSYIIKDLLGVTIHKSKRLQKADWGQRPLSSEAIEYAANDVRYLFALQIILDMKLQTLGRTTWVAEECARLEEVRYSSPNPDTAYLFIKGTHKLDGCGLAILRSLYLFREKEARRWRRPPTLLIPDIVLSSLANNPTMSLAEVPSLGQIGLKRFGRGLRKALHNGFIALPINRPPVITTDRLNNKQIKRLSLLKIWRTSLGETLSLDPSLLWPKASLERLAKAPDTLEIELKSKDIRHWQREQFASSLQDFLKSLP
jgi:ribonuclease D